jgi:hypothetical protein
VRAAPFGSLAVTVIVALSQVVMNLDGAIVRFVIKVISLKIVITSRPPSGLSHSDVRLISLTTSAITVTGLATAG